MKQYKELLQYILDNGTEVSDRTGVGTISVFGYQMRFNLQEGFPAVTTKKLAWKAVVGELMWFLEGSTDERRLAELTYGKPREELKDKTTIWTANADAQGKALGYQNDDEVKGLGPVYGFQWRHFGEFGAGMYSVPGFDQIKWIISEIKKNPDSRRLIVSAWAADAISVMALPPCHCFVQLKVVNGKLSCMMTQRSVDSFLGLPFNIASYALLTHIIAKECNLEVGDLVMSLGDAHIYKNHVEQVKLQLTREPASLPILKIDGSFDLMPRLNSKFQLNDSKLFTLENYFPQDSIYAPMAV